MIPLVSRSMSCCFERATAPCLDCFSRIWDAVRRCFEEIASFFGDLWEEWTFVEPSRIPDFLEFYQNLPQQEDKFLEFACELASNIEGAELDPAKAAIQAYLFSPGRYLPPFLEDFKDDVQKLRREVRTLNEEEQWEILQNKNTLREIGGLAALLKESNKFKNVHCSITSTPLY